MSNVKILPEILSNKIAAGEVVERPSSVVKELIENSIDAGSTRIIIEVENGGRSLIQVSDNGSGMNRDDALLSIERYGTSKILNESDLFSIRTLGFRGEALPSIASVSRFTLETRDESSESGIRIEIEGGKIKNVSEAGIPKGTLIAVKNLFYNVPVRRKFLKTVNTEMGHIADTISCIALGWPQVQFRFHHNEKCIKNWIAVSEPAERVIDVLGSDIKQELRRIDSMSSSIQVSGWIATPRVTRTTAGGIYIYVNGRFVKDRVIQHALFEGYSGRLMKGQYPIAVLFIHVPPDSVDVNVHPTKHEVRFSDPKTIHEAVSTAVSEVLNRSEQFRWPEKFKPEMPKPEKLNSPISINNKPSIRIESKVSESTIDFKEGEGLLSPHAVSPSPNSSPPLSNLPLPSREISLKSTLSGLRIIGQFHGTYIICESDEGLILVDQHAAHERILFEQLKDRVFASKMTVQSLLIPETLELKASESIIMEQLLPHFKDMGLDIEPFGRNTFVVKSAPALLAGREIRPILMEIVEKMLETGFKPELQSAVNECLMLIACHTAIRANQSLSEKEMYELLNQLETSKNPSNCPHGRPTWIKWTSQFLEKSFGRVV